MEIPGGDRERIDDAVDLVRTLDPELPVMVLTTIGIVAGLFVAWAATRSLQPAVRGKGQRPVDLPPHHRGARRGRHDRELDPGGAGLASQPDGCVPPAVIGKLAFDACRPPGGSADLKMWS